jgi:hypothetical protein
MAMFDYDPQAPDFFVLVEFPREAAPPDGDWCRFEVPASLLTRSSPVFASMVDTVWRESCERRLTVTAFRSEDFLAFLQCLALTDMRAEFGDFALTPACVRQVMPLASYYQVEPLKDFVIASVQQALDSTRSDRVELAADLVVAIEESLPEIEHVPWGPEILGALTMRMLSISTGKLTSSQSTSHTIRTDVRYRDNEGTRVLSRRTLQRCIESLCLGINTKLTLDNIARIYNVNHEMD